MLPPHHLFHLVSLYLLLGRGRPSAVNQSGHTSQWSYPPPVLQLMQISLTAIINVTDVAPRVCVVKMLQRYSNTSHTEKRNKKTRQEEQARILKGKKKSPVVLSWQDVTRGHSRLQFCQCTRMEMEKHQDHLTSRGDSATDYYSRS